MITGSNDGKIVLWDTHALSRVATLRTEAGHVGDIAFSPDSQLFAWSAVNRGISRVEIRETRTGQSVQIIQEISLVTCLRFSPDSRGILIGNRVGGITIWNIERGTPVQWLGTNSGFATSIALAQAGRVLISGHDDGVALLWDIQSGEPLRAFFANAGPVSSVDISSDGTVAATGHRYAIHASARTWNASTGEL
jgi:WD40 repeat protein